MLPRLEAMSGSVRPQRLQDDLERLAIQGLGFGMLALAVEGERQVVQALGDVGVFLAQ